MFASVLVLILSHSVFFSAVFLCLHSGELRCDFEMFSIRCFAEISPILLILATKFFGCFCMGLHVLKEKKETFLAFLPLQYNTVCINFQQKVLIQ